MQISITVVFILLSIFSISYQQFYIQNSWLCIISIILSIVIMYILVYTELSRKVPINYVLLGVFTLSESYMASIVGLIHKPQLILLAAILTLMITLGLTYYAFTTKSDVTTSGSIIFILFSLIIGIGIV